MINESDNKQVGGNCKTQQIKTPNNWEFLPALEDYLLYFALNIASLSAFAALDSGVDFPPLRCRSEYFIGFFSRRALISSSLDLQLAKLVPASIAIIAATTIVFVSTFIIYLVSKIKA